MDPRADLGTCLRFFSRLPVPAPSLETQPENLSQAFALAPIAGAVIAVLPCIVLLVSIAIGLPSPLAAPLAIATLLAITGALHEDGLADCADGFGGGATRERKLEIMRDSRTGAFGACAIALSIYARVMSLGLIAISSPFVACATLIAAASLSRTASFLPLLLLPPARTDGLGHATGHPELRQVWIAGGLAVLLALPAMLFGATLARVLVAVAFAAISGLAVSAVAWREIRGQTGDVAGAAQQVAEIAVLLVFTAI